MSLVLHKVRNLNTTQKKQVIQSFKFGYIFGWRSAKTGDQLVEGLSLGCFVGIKLLSDSGFYSDHNQQLNYCEHGLLREYRLGREKFLRNR